MCCAGVSICKHVLGIPIPCPWVGGCSCSGVGHACGCTYPGNHQMLSSNPLTYLWCSVFCMTYCFSFPGVGSRVCESPMTMTARTPLEIDAVIFRKDKKYSATLQNIAMPELGKTDSPGGVKIHLGCLQTMIDSIRKYTPQAIFRCL